MAQATHIIMWWEHVVISPHTHSVLSTSKANACGHVALHQATAGTPRALHAYDCLTAPPSLNPTAHLGASERFEH